MTLRSHQRLVLCGFAVVGWAWCGAAMGIGLKVAPLQTALVIDAVAAAWVSIVILLDFFVVALLIERDLAMFGSPLGTWIPFALIFLATLAVGWVESARRVPRERRSTA